MNYTEYRVALYNLNCHIFGMENKQHILDYINFGFGLPNHQLHDTDIEVIRLLDEFTLFNCFEDHISIDGILNDNFISIKQSLIYKDKSSRVRKNKKKDFINKFLFKNSNHLNNILTTHIIILILRTLKKPNFNTKINSTEVDFSNREHMIQKVVAKIATQLKIFLDFYSMYEAYILTNNYEQLVSIIFYILNIMSNVPEVNSNVLQIQSKKSVTPWGVCTINTIKPNIKIINSTWSDINIYYNKFKLVFLNNIDYLCPLLFLYSNNIIKQKYSKMESKYTADFKNTLFLMANTKIFICYKMLEEVKFLVDADLKNLMEEEEILLKKFKNGVDSYNEYKIEHNLEISEFWITSSLDILIEDYKKMTINNNTEVKNLSILQKIYDDFKPYSTKDIATKFKKIVGSLNNDNKKILEKIKNKKYYLQVEISKIQKHVAKIASINFWYLYYKFLNESNINCFYLQAYTDFRGRAYYRSPVSIQSGWMYRYLYHLGNIDINVYKNTAVQLPVFFKLEMYGAMKSCNIFDIRLFYTIFAIGLVFKENVLIKDGYRDMGDMFYNGLEVYKKYIRGIYNPQNISCKKLVELVYLSNIVTSVTADTVKMWYIIKDTNASVNQHMGKILGFKENSLKFVNLDNTYKMYDTYELYVNYFKNMFEKTNTDIVKYITRDFLKNTIMTVPYGIGSTKAFKNFCDSADDLKIHKTTKKNLLRVFNKIYRTLHSQIIEREYLYKKCKGDFKEATKGFKSFCVSDFELYIDYFKVKNVVIEYKFLGKRKSLVIDVVDNNIIDKKKTETAIFVNLIHMLDSSFLRRLVLKLNEADIRSLTIHDSFCVSFYDVGFLILYANDSFCVEENCNIFLDINAGLSIKSESILI